jgi:hypothetical protein
MTDPTKAPAAGVDGLLSELERLCHEYGYIEVSHIGESLVWRIPTFLNRPWTALTATEALPRQDDGELREALCFLGKWIERGLFCKTVTAKEALSMMAHFPGMPWNSERWDVDHKPYAAAYYEAFPKTRAALSASEGEK